MFSDMWVDLVFQAHAEVPAAEAVLFTRDDGTVVCVRYLVADFAAPDFRASRLVVGGTAAGGEHCTEVYVDGADDFPAELAPLIGELARAWRDCPWEL